jgi:hypothetical protein
MEQYDDLYIFTCYEGFADIVAGTTKDIAYSLFKDHINSPKDGYGAVLSNQVGPFWLEFDPQTHKPFVTLLFDGIEPKPEHNFWEEMNRYLERFFKLTAFT